MINIKYAVCVYFANKYGIKLTRYGRKKTISELQEQIYKYEVKNQKKLYKKKDVHLNVYGMYLNDELEGGAVDLDTVEKLLSNSYSDKSELEDDINNYKLDTSLSGERAQVYYNDLGHAYVVHRGTKDKSDIITDIGMMFGIKNNKRFKHADKVQKQAISKYGNDNITTLGHSLGASIAEKVGRRGEVVTLNKPVTPLDIFKRVQKNQYDYKTQNDPISFLRGFQKGGHKTVIKSKSYNPFAEHTTSTLSRLKR